MKEKLIQIAPFSSKFESIAQLYDVIQAFFDPIRLAINYVVRISKENLFPLTAEENCDGLNVINSNLDKLISAINGIADAAKKITGGTLPTDMPERSTQIELMVKLSTLTASLAEAAQDLRSAIESAADANRRFDVYLQARPPCSVENGNMESAEKRLQPISGRQSMNMDQKWTEIAMPDAKEVSEMVAIMQQIARKISIKQIAQKKSAIKQVALETDLLALKTAIEAEKGSVSGKDLAGVTPKKSKLAKLKGMATDDINFHLKAPAKGEDLDADFESFQ